MKYSVTTTFSLYGEIEPDINGEEAIGNDDEVNDLSDNSYFGSSTVEIDGGELTYTVDAENEDDAESKACDIVSEGSEITDGNGFTWVVQDVSHSVEAVEMSKEAALTIIQRLLSRLLTEGVLTSEEREAFDVILQDV